MLKASKYMKKGQRLSIITAIFMVIVMLFAMTACDNGTGKQDPTGNPATDPSGEPSDPTGNEGDGQGVSEGDSMKVVFFEIGKLMLSLFIIRVQLSLLMPERPNRQKIY